MRRLSVLATVCVIACKPATPPTTVALITPVGIVDTVVRTLLWHPISDALEYEVQLSDSSMTPLLVQRTRDTSVTLPPAMRLTAQNNYRWFVTAYRPRDSTAWRSPVAVFTVP
jgi:hypothetical protein